MSNYEKMKSLIEEADLLKTDRQLTQSANFQAWLAKNT